MDNYQNPESVSFPFGSEIPTELQGKVRTRVFPSHSFLARPDEPAEDFYYIERGRIQVFHMMENSWIQTIRFYSTGDILGDMELFKPDTYSCYVQALCEVECLSISMKILREFLNTRPELLWRMGLSLATKLQNHGVALAGRMRHPLRNRIALYLVTLSDFEYDNEKLLELKADNLGELASVLGCSYRHLTRTLKEMEDEGLIRRTGGELLPGDIESLRKLSDVLM